MITDISKHTHIDKISQIRSNFLRRFKSGIVSQHNSKWILKKLHSYQITESFLDVHVRKFFGISNDT